LQFLGASLSSLVAGQVANKIGRKMTILLSDAGYIAGAIIMFVLPHYIFLYLGRFVIGVAIGFSIVSCTLFLSESSPD
jgi:MFS transporter, SP family, sugar:H+ symporter